MLPDVSPCRTRSVLGARNVEFRGGGGGKVAAWVGAARRGAPPVALPRKRSGASETGAARTSNSSGSISSKGIIVIDQSDQAVACRSE